MGIRRNSHPTLDEKELFELLVHVLSGSSEDHKSKRVEGLEELQRRIKADSIKDENTAVSILLDMAKTQGNNRPESSLIIDSLILFIEKNEDVYRTVLDGLKGKEERLFSVFSKVVLLLDYNKKREAIKYLVDFLMSRDVLNSVGAKEVYVCLASLGNERLRKEIVKQVSPYLDSSPFRTSAIIFSVRLCSRFGDYQPLPKMLEVLQKSMKGYFNGHYTEIEREICQFIGRVNGLQSLPLLMSLLKMRSKEQTDHINKAIARVLDAYPYRVDSVLETLYDERRNGDIINAILQCFLEMETPKIDATKLLSNIDVDWWHRHPYVRASLHRLFVKMGELTKPTLFKILQEKEKFDFALECLKAIGISKEELSKIFPKPPMLDVYDFLYSDARSKKIRKDLNQLWEEKLELRENMPGTTDKLEHFLFHIFTSFNFVTLNVAPLKEISVDIVSFYPETLDLFIIGCTTGILKDDLAKMNVLVRKMGKELTDLFKKCSITPIVVSSEDVSISTSDALYSAQNNIVILQLDHIDKLMEMLMTNRKSRDVIEYIKSCRLPLEIPSPR